MKKRIIVLALVLSLLFAIALTGCGSTTPPANNPPADSGPTAPPADSGSETPPASDEVYEISYAHFFPTTHPVHIRHEAWAQALSEASNGRIKIVFHYGETLLKAAETYEGVVSGIADMGLVVPSYTPGLFPMTELYELPVNYNNCEVISKVLWETYKEFQPAEWNEVQVLGMYAIGPGAIATNKPVTNMKELSGLQIRATGTCADYMTALGAAPVSITMPESYEAVSRGTCDGVLNAWDAFITWKLVEVADYFTATPFLYVSPFVQVMNKDTWNSLPADIQQIFTEVTEEFISYHASMEAEACLTSIQAILDAGKEIIVLSPEEETAWYEAAQASVDKSIEDRASKGPAREFYDHMVALAEEYNGDYPSVKDAVIEMIG